MHTHNEKMNRGTKRRPMWVGALVATTLGLGVALSSNALEAKPTVIEFEKIEAAATIELSHNGQPLPASAIKSVKLYVESHDYDHMIDVEKADGKVVVRPSDQLEIGSYNLVIDTAEGKASVALYAPLDKLYTSLESRSTRLGITVDELKQRLGLTQVIGNEIVDMNLPKVYYLGQTLRIPMERSDDRIYTWAVNGAVVEVGKGETTMNYTFMEPGIYDFTYVEREGDRVVAHGFGATTVVPEPPIHLHVAVNGSMKFKAPEGYAHYVWEVDGVKQGLAEELTHDFVEKGSHVVTVHAHRPTESAKQAIRAITYVVTAT